MAGFTSFRKSAVSTVKNWFAGGSPPSPRTYGTRRHDDCHLISRAAERNLDSVTNPGTADA
jgi:hypothetical protein